MAQQTTFIGLCSREVRDLLYDRWLLSLLSWIPPLLLGMMWYIFSQGLATELPVGVVDLDKSALSRSLVRHYNASPSLAVADHYLNEGEAVRDLRTGRIYGLVVIPRGLQEDATKGLPPTVTTFVNNQFLLIGKILNSALFQAHGTFTTRVEVGRNMVTATPIPSQALTSAIPIGSQVTPLFNIGKNYAQFLVSAILPAIWQIVMIAGTILSMALTRRKYGISGWLKHSPYFSLLAKMVVLVTLFMGHGLGYLGFMYGWLGWPMRGDWQVLIAAQLLTAMVSVGIGCLIFLLQHDAARCLSVATAYVAPGLAFMGVTFPVSDMTLPARIWRSLIPICHYIEIQISQVNYGAPPATVAAPIQNLTVFLLPLVVCFYLIRRMKRSNSTDEAIP